MSINVFSGKKDVNIVFLGGSITEGACASSQKRCFANLTGEWLKEFSGDINVRYYNEGVGGTPSEYGLLRLERDVILHNPDMVFIEFAVNDNGKDTRKYLEAMVRTLSNIPSNPYIAFIYTTNATYETPTSYFEEVANYYGLPQISLKNALKEKLNGKNAKDEGYLADGVHPNDKGHYVYFEEMKRCLSSLE